MANIELEGNANNLQDRMSFVTTLLNNAESKINHFDALRQRNLVVALAVFSGMSGFIVSAKGSAIAIAAAVSLAVVIAMFCILDRRFRRYSHGWQKTRGNMVHAIEVMINTPDKKVTFPAYDIRGEKERRFWSVISLLYLILLAGAILSYVVYRASISESRPTKTSSLPMTAHGRAVI